MSARNYTIRPTSSAAPVQYEGEVDGKAWYFRARYDSWSFGVGDDHNLAVAAAMDGNGWFQTAEYDPDGDGWGASWMEHSLAESLIGQCITNYRSAQARG